LQVDDEQRWPNEKKTEIKTHLHLNVVGKRLYWGGDIQRMRREKEIGRWKLQHRNIVKRDFGRVNR